MENKLNNVECLLNRRVYEANKLVEGFPTMNFEQLRINKSVVILMLYNAIEGTLSNILENTFDYICDNDIEFRALNTKIQTLLLKYRIRKIGTNTKELFDFYNDDKLSNVSYLQISNYLKLYSGNLDARKIKELSKELGVTVSKVAGEEKLLIVKAVRNKLAHGEVGFSEACKDISDKEIIKIVEAVQRFMQNLINEYNSFILHQLKTIH